MHVVYQGVVIPVVFALLPNKKQQTYHRLIDKLFETCPSWKPKFIMMDFERPAINEFGGKFTTTTMSGCFFLFQNSIHRKMQVSI